MIVNEASPDEGLVRPRLKCHDCPARRSELCGTMDDSSIGLLFSQGHAGKVGKSEYLFMEEAPSDYVYNVSSGVFILERIGSDGRRQIITFTYPGDYIGLTVGESYSVSCRAVEAGSYCRWSKNDIETLALAHPELEKSLRLIGNKVLARTIDQIVILGRKNAIERLAFFLIQTSKRQAHAGQSDTLISLPMTRTDIADYLGLTIETVSRAFSQLARDGVIKRLAQSQIEILSPDKLSDYAEYHPA